MVIVMIFTMWIPYSMDFPLVNIVSITVIGGFIPFGIYLWWKPEFNELWELYLFIFCAAALRCRNSFAKYAALQAQFLQNGILYVKYCVLNDENRK